MSEAETADRYRYFLPITTRWMDNDVYGHINNVTYYSYFDTVANHYLIHEGGLDIHASPVIGLVVESRCSYRAPLAYPDRLRAGLRVDKLGNRSVTLRHRHLQGGRDAGRRPRALRARLRGPAVTQGRGHSRAPARGPREALPSPARDGGWSLITRSSRACG